MSGPAPPTRPRRGPPFRDNPSLILAGIAILLALLAALVALASNTHRFTPDFLTEFVLYALSAANLTVLVVLVFVLACNIAKLVMERRRGRPFARFRAKLVALLLGMALVPTIIVLLVGSELIRTNIDGWFNAQMGDILAAANRIAGDYYYERQLLVSENATRIASRLAAVDLTSTDVGSIHDLLSPDVAMQRVQMVAVYRIGPAIGALPGLEPVLDVAAPALPPGYSRAAADRLAAQAFGGSAETRSIETLGPAGDLLHAAAVIRGPDGRPKGVAVATDHLTGDMADRPAA